MSNSRASTLSSRAGSEASASAARASHHYRIEKSHGEGGTRTSVRKLSAEERREEIARMLSGASITAEARAQAAKLLEAA